MSSDAADAASSPLVAAPRTGTAGKAKKTSGKGSVDLSTGGGGGGGASISLSATASTAVMSPFAVPVSSSGGDGDDDDAIASPPPPPSNRAPLPSSPTATRAKSSAGGIAPKATAKLPPIGAKKKDTGAARKDKPSAAATPASNAALDDEDASLPRGERRVIGDGPQFYESAAYAVQGRRDNMEDRHSVCASFFGLSVALERRSDPPHSHVSLFPRIPRCFCVCSDHFRPDAQPVRKRDGRHQAQLFRCV